MTFYKQLCDNGTHQGYVHICYVNGYLARMHIKDTNGSFRVRIDSPDNVTSYQHVHILDEFGNPLDIEGNIVSRKSPDGHIPWNN